MANYKQTASAEYVAESITLRTGMAAVVDQSGTDPKITFGTATAGNKGCTVQVYDQVQGVDNGWKALPGFGSTTQPVYTGTGARIIVEAINTGTGAFPITLGSLTQVIGDLVRRGMRVELWTVSVGQPPTPAGTGLAAVAGGAFEPNLYWNPAGRT